MIKVLSICASPVEGSSTEILLRRIADSIAKHAKPKTHHRLVRLNDLDITPCQACGEDPSPEACFINDDMTSLYSDLIKCDCLLFGSPIYFDSVSAQAKLFIDRCNCLRAPLFGVELSQQRFVSRVPKRRPGAMVIVGGEQAWFEGARRCLAGFFKWVRVSNEACLKFCSTDYNLRAEAAVHKKILAEADRIGRNLVGKIGKDHA